MNSKEVTFGREARQKLIFGIQTISDAVISTYGPRSRNVIIKREYAGPHIVHDGVTVAKNIILDDPIEDTGAQLIFQASANTNSEAGDGTTTVALLASTLIREGDEITSRDIMSGKLGGVNPMELRDKFNEYSDKICESLRKHSISAKKREVYERVAVISSGSEKIGKIVADAVEAVSNDGVIMVEKDQGFDDSLEIKRGFEFDRGYLSSYFITNGDRYTVEYDNVMVLVTDYTIRNLNPLADLIQKLSDKNTPLLIIAETVEGAALEALARMKMAGVAKVVAVSAPEFADTRKQMLEDIALATGAKFVSSELSEDLADVEFSDLGKCSSAYITQSTTKIVPEIMDDELKERVATVKNQIKAETNDIKRGKLEKRLSMLSGTVAVINVGGASEVEVNEKYERYIDAVNATKAAVSDGVLAGGGLALVMVAEEMFTGDSPEEQLVHKALTAPIKKLISNSGLSESLLEQIDIEKGIGIDVITGKAVNMFEEGIIDPVRVTISAVRNSFSVAGTALTSDTIITDKKPNVQEMRLIK